MKKKKQTIKKVETELKTDSEETKTKWLTYNCGRCGETHHNYTGKLDKNGVEYVVCGNTNKRMNVSGKGPEDNSWAYPTIWLKEML